MSEKPCPACGELRERIGQEVSEQLEYLPASFKVLRHIRHKYGCRRCEHDGYNPQIAAAAKPAQPIDKGLPGPGLLAYVATSKLGDHLPLYRLEHIFRGRTSRSPAARCARGLRPRESWSARWSARMIERILLSRNIHTDDTPVPVQSPGEGKCRKGRLWAYLGDAANPYIVYDYTPDRTRAGPASWLRDYKGFLQADAYGGYDGIYHTGKVVEVACWAHARRKFFEAKETDGRRAAEMLALVRELYAVEDAAKTLDDDARRELRQVQSVPILARIKAWLDAEQQDRACRAAPMGQAIQYALNQWTALCVYATEGFLAIDNNAAERAMKRVAIGRKNWLFAGNDRAGETTALLYTLIASAERHGVDPQRYLTSVFAKLPFTPEERNRPVPAGRVEARGRGRAADAANVFLNGTLVVRSTAPSSPPGTARVSNPLKQPVRPARQGSSHVALPGHALSTAYRPRSNRAPLGVNLPAPLFIAASSVVVSRTGCRSTGKSVRRIWAVPRSEPKIKTTHGAKMFAVYGSHGETPGCAFQ